MCVLHGGNGSCVHTHLEKKATAFESEKSSSLYFEFVLTSVFMVCNVKCRVFVVFNVECRVFMVCSVECRVFMVCSVECRVFMVCNVDCRVFMVCSGSAEYLWFVV